MEIGVVPSRWNAEEEVQRLLDLIPLAYQHHQDLSSGASGGIDTDDQNIDVDVGMALGLELSTEWSFAPREGVSTSSGIGAF